MKKSRITSLSSRLKSHNSIKFILGRRRLSNALSSRSWNLLFVTQGLRSEELTKLRSLLHTLRLSIRLVPHRFFMLGQRYSIKANYESTLSGDLLILSQYDSIIDPSGTQEVTRSNNITLYFIYMSILTNSSHVFTNSTMSEALRSVGSAGQDVALSQYALYNSIYVPHSYDPIKQGNNVTNHIPSFFSWDHFSSCPLDLSDGSSSVPTLDKTMSFLLQLIFTDHHLLFVGYLVSPPLNNSPHSPDAVILYDNLQSILSRSPVFLLQASISVFSFAPGTYLPPLTKSFSFSL